MMRQCGVDYAVCHGGLQTIPGAAAEDQPWSLSSLKSAKDAYERCGLELAVWEGRPDMEKIKLGLPGRDGEIEVVCAMLRNMGELGIPVWCSMWMPILGVMRTSFELLTRAGARVSGFDHAQLKDQPLTEHGVVPEDEQWDNLRYFLERTLPAAEAAGVKMAMHPDDPPLSPIRGVARIMSNLDNYQRLVDLVPSEANGIALCQGNFALMTDDLGRLPELVALGRRARRVIRQNIAASLAAKALVLGLAAFGHVSLWAAVAADVGTSLVVVLHGLTLLRGSD